MRIAARVIQAAHAELPMAALLATATVAEMSSVVRDHAAGPRPPA